MFLIFFPKNINETPSNPTNNPSTSTPENSTTPTDPTPSDPTPDESSPSTNPPASETYASKLTLNCARQVTISVGNKLELLSNYISVTPSNLITNVAVKITPKNDASSNGIAFANNTITPNSVGVYNVKFSIPKSATGELTDTLVVTVVEANQDTRIIQTKDFSTLNEVIAISSLFTIDTTIDSIYITNDNIEFSNNSIKGIAVGNTTLNLKLIDNYFCFNYSFNHTIKSIPEYTIEIEEENNGVVEIICNVGDTILINYAVLDKNRENIHQNLIAETDETGIATVIMVEDPIIYIQCKSKGSCKLTIKSNTLDLEDKVGTLIFK